MGQQGQKQSEQVGFNLVILLKGRETTVAIIATVGPGCVLFAVCTLNWHNIL